MMVLNDKLHSDFLQTLIHILQAASAIRNEFPRRLTQCHMMRQTDQFQASRYQSQSFIKAAVLHVHADKLEMK